MMKVILKVELRDDSIKQKIMKAVTGLPGVESVSMDMKDKKLTLIDNIDPVSVVGKLRKLCQTEILSVGPAKEKEEKKKEETKEEKNKYKMELNGDLLKTYENYYQSRMKTQNYYPSYPTPTDVKSTGEDPKACVCVIC